MLENTEGVVKKDNPETTLGAQEEDKRNKNTTQYVLDFTMRKQTHTLRKQDMRPTTNYWRQRRTEHRFLFFAEIVTDMNTTFIASAVASLLLDV
jgi:hypothetical protein